MKNNTILMVLMIAAIVLSGCVDTADKEGWHSGQKSEFLEILKTDKYLSICNKRGLYEKVRASHNSVLMSKMLVAYTENLANGCIDLKAFNEVQKARNSVRFSSKYTTYLQEVNVRELAMKLKAGQSIEQILQTYIPEYYQFDALLK